MNNEIDEGTEGGSMMGFQMPIPSGIKKRKERLDDLIKLNPDINEGHVLSYFSGMDEQKAEEIGQHLDNCNFEEVVNNIRNHVIRETIRKKIKEIVRKKAGGGGYVLYSPNKGKKREARPVGDFPTKIGAKQAELQRFPPKDMNKLKRLRLQIARLMKDPKKRAEKEREWAKEKGVERKKARPIANKTRKEGLDNIREALSKVILESLFNESSANSKKESSWEDYLSGISKQVIAADKKLQNLQRNIEKKTQAMLDDAFKVIGKSIDKKAVKLKNFGIKHSSKNDKIYLAFSSVMSNVEVEPIYIYISDTGTPIIKISDRAKVDLTKVDPDVAKLFRADLITVQERVLDNMDELKDAISSRDAYLTKLQDEIDGFVSDLSSLQISLLKQLLAQKYRRLS
jgi:hypothetical protein